MAEAIQKKDPLLLEKVIIDLNESIHYKVKTAGSTMRKWKQEILNFFTTNMTNACTE